ncbi:MAG: lysylphosphatidylglycerol synthase transmembrane domain-containing protein [Candidatus Altiarchaeota archaeon]
MKKKSSILKILPSLIVSIFLLSILLSQVEFSDIVDTLKKIHFGYLLIAFILYITFNFFRAVRFQLLLNKISFFDILLINFMNVFLLNILPSRTGDLFYIYALKKKKISLKLSAITLFIARVLDAISIAILFFISLLLIGPMPTLILNTYLTFILVLLVFLFIPTIIYFLIKSPTINKLLKNFFCLINLDRVKFIKFTTSKFQEFSSIFNETKIRENFVGLFIYSLLIWISSNVLSFVLVQAMNVNADIFIVIITSSLVVLSSLIPIQGIAGFGIIEGTWATTFILFGIPKELAISSGIALHIIILVFSTILGVTSYIIYKNI